jgi:hypothetical protein
VIVDARREQEDQHEPRQKQRAGDFEPVHQRADIRARTIEASVGVATPRITPAAWRVTSMGDIIVRCRCVRLDAQPSPRR